MMLLFRNFRVAFYGFLLINAAIGESVSRDNRRLLWTRNKDAVPTDIDDMSSDALEEAGIDASSSSDFDDEDIAKFEAFQQQKRSGKDLYNEPSSLDDFDEDEEFYEDEMMQQQPYQRHSSYAGQYPGADPYGYEELYEDELMQEQPIQRQSSYAAQYPGADRYEDEERYEDELMQEPPFQRRSSYAAQYPGADSYEDYEPEFSDEFSYKGSGHNPSMVETELRTNAFTQHYGKQFDLGEEEPYGPDYGSTFGPGNEDAYENLYEEAPYETGRYDDFSDELYEEPELYKPTKAGRAADYGMDNQKIGNSEGYRSAEMHNMMRDGQEPDYYEARSDKKGKRNDFDDFNNFDDFDDDDDDDDFTDFPLNEKDRDSRTSGARSFAQTTEEKKKKISLPYIIGGAVASALVVIALIVFLVQRKKKVVGKQKEDRLYDLQRSPSALHARHPSP